MPAAKKKLKNYTSEVAASKSVHHIEEVLVQAGARDILKNYDPNGNLEGLCFRLECAGVNRMFRLPAQVARVEAHLLKGILRPHKGTTERMAEQAQRTAWKLLSDWVDVQMSLVALEQAELAQIFLAYMWDPNKKESLYDKLKGSDFKMLAAPNH